MTLYSPKERGEVVRGEESFLVIICFDLLLIGGLEPVGDARSKFDILYYVIGI